MSGILVDVNVDKGKAERDLASLDKSIKNIEKTTQLATGSVKKMVQGFAAAATGAFSVSLFKSITSEFKQLENKIALVTGRTVELTRAQNRLFEITEKTRSSAEGTVRVFNSFGRALKTAPQNIDSLLKATETIQKAVSISGSSAESASAGIMQLSQGLSSGVLRGEELNSVLEQLPRVAQMLTDELHITSGKLRELAAEGKLTTDIVFNAIKNQAAAVDSEFKTLQPTLAQAQQQLGFAAKRFIAEFDKGGQISATLGSNIARAAARLNVMSESASSVGAGFMLWVRDLQYANRAVIQAISEGVAATVSIAKPVSVMVGQLLKSFGVLAIGVGRMFLQMIPSLTITRTFRTFSDSVFNVFDELSGGFLTWMRFFKWDSLFTVRGPVELAIRDFRKLNPKLWTKGFNLTYLQAIVDAVSNLAMAVASNADSMLTSIALFTNKAGAQLRGLKKFWNTDSQFTITWAEGSANSFMATIAEMIRGLANVPIYITQVGRLISSNLLPDFYDVLSAMIFAVVKWAPKLIEGIGKGLTALPTIVITAFKGIGEALEKSGAVDSFKAFVFLVLLDIKGLPAALRASGVFDDISNALSEPFGKLSDIVKSAMTAASEKAATGLETLSTVFHKGLGSISKFFKSLWASVGSLDFSTAFGDSSFVSRWAVDVTKSVDRLVKTFKTGGSAFLKDFSDGFKEFFEIGNTVPKLESVLGHLVDALVTTSQYVNNLWTSVANSKLLDNALRAVKAFGEAVIQVFFKIYDEVIGHSWWTDTVETVESTADLLWANVKAPLKLFESNVVSIFENIYKGSKQLMGQFVEIFDLNDSKIAFKTQPITFENIISPSFREEVSRFTDDISKLLVTGLLPAGLSLITLLFPRTAFIRVLQAALLPGVLNLGLMVGAMFAKGLTDDKTASKLGYYLGTLSGEFLNTFTKLLPKIINSITAFVSSFVQGLAKTLPAVGGLLSGIFSIFNGVGLSNVFGLLGAAILGRSSYGLLNTLNLIPKPLKAIIGQVTTLFKANGVLSAGLFGKLGTTRMLAALGLVATKFGALDSVLGGSQLLKWGATGGLLATLIGGDSARNTVGRLVRDNLVLPLMASLGKGIRSITNGFPNLQELLLDVSSETSQTSTPFAARASTFVKAQIDAVKTEFLKHNATAGTGFVKDYISGLLFGDDPAATLGEIKATAQMLLNGSIEGVKELISKLKDKIAIAFRTYLSGSSGTASVFAPLIASSKQMFDDMLKASGAFMTRLRVRAGPNGVLGNFLLGARGPRNLAMLGIGALALLGTTAFAKEQPYEFTTKDLKPSPNYKIPEQEVSEQRGILAAIWDQKPFDLFLEGVAVIGLAKLTQAIVRFAVGSRLSMASIWDVVKVVEWFATAKQGMLGFIRNARAMQTSMKLATGAVGAYFGADFGSQWGELGSVIGGALGGGIGAAIIAILGETLAEAGAAILGAVLSITGALVAAFAATAGLLYVWIFGETGDLLTDLKSVWVRLKQILGLSKERHASGLEAGDVASYKQAGIDVNFDIARVDFDNLDSATKKRLETLLKQYKEAADQAVKSSFERSDGLADPALAAKARILGEQITREVDKVQLKKLATVRDPLDTLEKSQFDETKFQDPRLTYRGVFTGYARNIEKIRANVFGSPSDVLAANAGLQQQKVDVNTKFSSKWLGPMDEIDRVIKEKVTALKDIEIVDPDLSARYASAVNAYINAFDKYSAAQKDGLGPNVTAMRFNTFQITRATLADTAAEAVADDARRKNSMKFSTNLADILERLKAVGVTLEDAAAGGANQRDFEGLKRLSDEAKVLGEAKPTTPAERQALQTRINYVGIDVKALETAALMQMKAPKEALRTVLADRPGAIKLPDSVITTLSDEAARKIVAAVIEADTVRAKAGQASIGDISGLLLNYNSTPLEHVVTQNRTAEGKVDFTQLSKVLEIGLKSQLENIEMKSGARLQMLSESLSQKGVNVSSEAVYAKYGDKSLDRLKEIEAVYDAAQRAFIDGNATTYAEQSSLLEKLIAEVNEAKLKMDSLFSSIQGMGLDIDMASMLNISSKGFETLRQSVFDLSNLDRQLQSLDATASQAQFQKILADKLAVSRKAFEAYMEIVHATGQSIRAALGRAGVAESAQGYLGAATLEAFLKIDKVILRLQERLKDPANVVQFSEIARLLTEAENTRKRMLLANSSLKDRTEALNKATGFGVSEAVASRLDPSVFKSVTDDLLVAQAKIEEIMNRPINAEQKSSAKNSDMSAMASLVKGSEASASRDLLDAVAQLQTKRSAAKAAILSSGELQRGETLELSTLDIGELISRVTSLNPALEGFEETLRSLSNRELIELGAKGIDKKYDDAYGDLTPAERLARSQDLARSASMRIGRGSFSPEALMVDLKSVGESAEVAQLRMMDESKRGMLAGIVEGLRSAELAVLTAGDDAARKVAQQMVTQKHEEIKDALEVYGRDMREQSRAAGKSFAETISSGTKEGLSSLMRGQKTFKDFLLDLIGTFADTVINTFVDGLVEKMAGKSSGFGGWMSKLGSAIFGLGADPDQPMPNKGNKGSAGEDALGGFITSLGKGDKPEGEVQSDDPFASLTASFSEGWKSLKDTFGGVGSALLDGLGGIGGLFMDGLSGLGSLFSQGLSGLGSLFSSVGGAFGGIFSIFGFAEGGHVSGPGTGTSDSILAAISNGEFIMNARSTQKYLPLLEMMNRGMSLDSLSGTLSKRNLPKIATAFAAGGLAGASAMAIPLQPDIQPAVTNQQSSSQVFEINITGDVSRQTRAEIQKMLPSIAQGVNTHNRYKR